MELYQQLEEYSRSTRSGRMPVTRGSSPTWGNLMATLGEQRRRGSLPDQEHVVARAAGIRGRQVRVASVPDQRMVEQVREEERGRGGPPAPRNSVDLSVIDVDETIDVYNNSNDNLDNEVSSSEDDLNRVQDTFDELLGVPPVNDNIRSILDAAELARRPSLDTTIDLTDSPVRLSSSSARITTSSQSSRSPRLTNPSSPSSSLKCPVCLEAFSSIRRRGSRLVSTLCGHVFCGQCLPACVRTSGQCPTCRRTIGYRDFHPLYLY